MRSRLVRIALIAAAFWLAGCGGAATNGTGVSCSGSFKATTDLGIGEGLKLLGSLSFQVDSTGGLNGKISSGGQPDIIVVGQVSGRAVNLAAVLDGGTYLFGTGTVQSATNGCPKIAGGPLALESAPVSGTGPAKLLAPSSQVIIERTGIWFYSTK